MAKSNTRKIKIVSITYSIDNQEFTATPIEKNEIKNVLPKAGAAFDQCTPGDVRCKNGMAQRCFDIGNGQSAWMNTDEPC